MSKHDGRSIWIAPLVDVQHGSIRFEFSGSLGRDGFGMAGFVHRTGEHTREHDAMHSLKRSRPVESLALESSIGSQECDWPPGFPDLLGWSDEPKGVIVCP